MCLYRFTNTATGWKDKCDKSRLMSLKDLRGRWTDITLNYNSDGSGELTLYLNGEAKAREVNFVSFDADDVYVAYGIYRPQVARTSGTVPTQVIYVDEMRIGTSMKAVAISEVRPVD